MADLEAEKALAAARAVDEVKPGMMVGLGTGSTAAYAIRELGLRVSRGLTISVVATSRASEALARQVGLNPIDFAGVSRVDLTIDGADEVTRQLLAIKGGGGALLREKIVAAASDRVIVVVDSSKLVEVLGRFRLPVEILPFAKGWAARALRDTGVTAVLRERDGAPVITDQGNLLFDLPYGAITDPHSLATALSAIPGVIEHGLFLTEIDTVYVGRGSEVQELAS